MKFIKSNQDKFLFGFVALLFLGFCFLLLYRLGVHPYINWDESIYAQVAKESFLNHRFFDFTYFGVHWYEKPPLAFWLMSISYAIGGINEWSARIPAALGAIGMVIISLKWTYELRKSYTAVLLTMAGYFIMFPFITASYFINLDTIIGFFALLALYSWWKAISDPVTNSKWFIIFGAAIGLGLMAKSVLGFFPIVPIVIFALLQRDFKFLLTKQFWWGVLLAVLIIAPWHIYQSFVAGNAFWSNYFVYHVLDRYTTNLEGNGEPFWYFFEEVFYRYYLSLLVFGGGVLLSVWLAWKDRGIRYVLISVAALFLLFSISITKLPSYVTMVLPLIIMLTGLSITKLLDFVPRKWMGVLFVLILTAIFVYTGYAFNTYKLAQGEFTEEYISNKKVGEFLKDYRTDLPVYVNKDYKSLAIGYYAGRPLIPTIDSALINNATQRVFHQRIEQVFLGRDSNGKDYLIVVMY